MWRNREMIAIYEPRTEVSEGINFAKTFILSIYPPELRESTFLHVRHLFGLSWQFWQTNTAMYCLNFRSGGKMTILLGLHPNITISPKEQMVFSVHFSLKGNLPPSSKKLLEHFLSDLINLISAVCSVHWDKYQ